MPAQPVLSQIKGDVEGRATVGDRVGGEPAGGDEGSRDGGRYGSGDHEQLARVEKASKEIMHACVDAGGTIYGSLTGGMALRKYARAQ